MNTMKTYSLSFAQGEDRVAGLMNSLKVGVVLQGPGTEVLFCNEAALEMLGLSEDELYGRTLLPPSWDVIQEDGKPFLKQERPAPKAIRTKKPVENIVMGIFRPATSDRIWLLVNAIPVLDKKGDVREVICSFSDITERKISEEKLRWLYRDLEVRAFELATSNTDLEKFVKVATHDLQEPLRRITGFVQLLEKKFGNQLDDQSREYIKHAVDGAARMKKLIIDLLEYARFSSSREHFTATDMNEVVGKVKAALSEQLNEAGAELVYGPLPVIFSDTILITQLIENLLGNALKYRSAQPLRVHITCTEETGQFRFSVADNGIGIAAGYTDKVFNLFQRLHNNESYEGTGVGLAICQKIVRIHQGMIGVDSRPGKGSNFWFTIPKLKIRDHEEL